MVRCFHKNTWKAKFRRLLLDRIISLDDQPAFLVSGDRDVSDTKAVIITQKDVRQIQMGKGAINAGIVLLLKQKGLTPEDLDDLLLAGAFGNYIDRWKRCPYRASAADRTR